MPDPHAVKGQRQLLRLDDATARAVLRAYEDARKDLVDALAKRMLKLGPDPTAEQVRMVARDAGLIQEIEARLSDLAAEHVLILRQNLTKAQEIGLEMAQREIERLVARLGLNIRPFTGIDPQLPGLVQTILSQVERLSEQYRTTVTGELMTALIRGDDFRTIVQRILAADPGPEGISLARQGANSAELMARRTVIEANNASRQLVYEQAKEQVEGLKKQLVAAVQPDRTTVTCLKAHGQIREINEPYTLTGKPRFARKIMYPPFHWRCRSSSVAYHPQFEQGTQMTTEAMREAAQKELARREQESG